MIVCRFGEPFVDAAWPRQVCDIERLREAPKGTLKPYCPDFSETAIERAFLRRPGVLADALGLTIPHDSLLALRQVEKIDLYLRTPHGLHLLEVKRPDQYQTDVSTRALRQIANYWTSTATWIRRGDEMVHLWAMCPIRWSSRTGKGKLPADWRDDLLAVRTEKCLPPDVALGLLFYGIFRSRQGLVMFLWRADEPAPAPTIGDP